MQAEWEELARRNWLEESEDQGPVPPTGSPADTVSSEPSQPPLTPQTSVCEHVTLFAGFTQDALGLLMVATFEFLLQRQSSELF